jgi:hypothetical protein
VAHLFLERTFCFIAGIDDKVIVDCPRTDRLWASHLGFSLLVSFLVIFGIAYHSVGYVVVNPLARAAVSIVIALTIFMFDRALYQSDWFLQTRSTDTFKTGWSIFRIAIRLIISFGIAYVLSLFLELAIFADTISDKLQVDHIAANQTTYRKISEYEEGIKEGIEKSRQNVNDLEAAYKSELSDIVVLDENAQIQFDEYAQQKRTLDGLDRAVRNEIQGIDSEILKLEGDMNAEEEGQKVHENNSGQRGPGPKYKYAKKQKDVLEHRRSELQSQLIEIDTRRDAATAGQRQLSANALVLRDQERASREATH